MNSTSSQQKQESTSQKTNPWDVQTPYLNQGFNSAMTALNQSNNTQRPDQFVSQFTPDQLGLYSQMLGYGTQNGAIPGSSAAAGGALTGSGAGAVGQGLYGLAGFTPTSMSGVLNDANAAANDPSVQGRIDAAMRDARRSVSEDVLPGINRNAAGSGNLNSSRTGVREGIVERGLTDATADTSANIRGDAYKTGLSTALTRAMTGDSNSLSALQSLVSGGTGAVNAGVGANSGAVSQQAGLYDIANGGVAGQQAAAQAPLNDAMARYQMGVSSPFAGLDQFWNIIGSNNWGGSSTGTSTTNSTSTPSTWDTIGKMMTAVGSFVPGKK